MNLKTLLQQCKKNDRKAQEKLYRQYAGKLFLMCLKYSDDQQEAEDTLQDGFLKIFEKIHTYKGIGSFEGWMSRIMINTAIKRQKQKRLFLSISEEYPEEAEFELENDPIDLGVLLDTIQNLPVKYRMVFNMYVLDGHSHKEISEELDISEGTSKSNLSRARQLLKKQLTDYFRNKSAQSL